MNLEFLKTNILVVIATIVLGYVLGMSVIKTVDNRLSSISINMPKINVPPQKIFITTDDENKIILNQGKTQNLEGFKVNDLEELKQLKNLRENDDEHCLDVYTKWSESKDNSIKLLHPNCFSKKGTNKNVKKMNNVMNLLKRVSKDDICDRVRYKADKIENPSAKKLAKKMFAPCYTEDEELNENFQSYSRIDGKDICDVETKSPRKPLKREKLEEYKKALGLDKEEELQEQSTDLGMLKKMTKEEKEEDEKMEKELMKLKDKVKKRIENESQNKVCETDEDCNEFNGNGENICKSNGKCYCIKGSGSLCEYGPTNYMDPKDMTKEQRNRFENMQDLSKMTIQDYINWLNLYKKKMHELSESHFINMQKLKKGEQIKLIDIPKANITPERNVHSYFAKLWETGYAYGVNEEKMKDKILSYNYSDYEEYIPPKKIKDYKVLNPDLVYKKDPVAVNNFLMPRDSSVETERLIRKSKSRAI